MKKYFVKIYDEDGDSSISGEYDTEKEALERREELIKSGFDYVGAFKRKTVNEQITP